MANDKSKKLGAKKFVKTWLAKFKWLENKVNTHSKCNLDQAYCNVCNEFQVNQLSDLLQHEKTKKHIENEKVK